MPQLINVDMSKEIAVKIGATGFAGLEQEIRTLLSTRKGSVPLDRDFGITWDYVDMPINDAMPYIVAEIGMQLEKYVPRISVKDIAFSSDDALDGQLKPKVICEIREEYFDDFR